MKNNVIVVLLIGLVLLFAGCQSTGAELQSSSSDVYMGGTALDASGKMSAKVWKNGEDYPLALDGITMSEVKSVFVDSKGNVYAAGFTQDESGATLATVWKNGKRSYLNSEGAIVSQANSIFVTEDGTVYVAGVVSSEGFSIGAKVWKDGENYPLNLEGATSSQASSISVAKDGTVYVGGLVLSLEKGGMGRRVWKDGEDYPLGAKEGTEEDFGISFPLSLYLDEKGSVYVGVLKSGVSKDALIKDVSDDVPITDIAKSAFQFSVELWKDGEEYPLSIDAIKGTTANASLYVTPSGDIYVATTGSMGLANSTTKMWKNGEVYPLNLEGLTDMVVISAMGVATDGTVYAAGYRRNMGGYFSISWKNGEIYPLNLEGITTSYIMSVYVAP